MSATMTFCVLYTTTAVTLSVYVLIVWGMTLITLTRYKELALVGAVLIANATSLYVYCDCGHSQSGNVSTPRTYLRIILVLLVI